MYLQIGNHQQWSEEVDVLEAIARIMNHIAEKINLFLHPLIHAYSHYGYNINISIRWLVEPHLMKEVDTLAW